MDYCLVTLRSLSLYCSLSIVNCTTQWTGTVLSVCCTSKLAVSFYQEDATFDDVDVNSEI